MALKGDRLLRPSRRFLEVERALRLDEAERTAHGGADHHYLRRLQTSTPAHPEIWASIGFRLALYDIEETCWRV